MIKFKITQSESSIEDSFSLKITPIEDESFLLSFLINKEDGEFINYLLKYIEEANYEDDDDDDKPHNMTMNNDFFNKLTLYKSIMATCEAGGSFISGISICDEKVNDNDLMFGVLYLSAIDGGYLINSLKISFSTAMILSIIGGMFILMSEELLKKLMGNSANNENGKEDENNKDNKDDKRKTSNKQPIIDEDINNFVKNIFSKTNNPRSTRSTSKTNKQTNINNTDTTNNTNNNDSTDDKKEPKKRKPRKK